MDRCVRLRSACVLLVWLSITTAGYGAGEAFCISPQGSDGNPGTESQPFGTLEAARDAAREVDRSAGVTIWLRGGVYERTKALQLTDADSGTPGHPVIYRAWPNEEARIVGGKVVEGWKPVTDRAILDRLVPEARGQVLQVDLKVLGLTDYGQVKGGGMELFFDDRPMTLRSCARREATSNAPPRRGFGHPVTRSRRSRYVGRVASTMFSPAGAHRADSPRRGEGHRRVETQWKLI